MIQPADTGGNDSGPCPGEQSAREPRLARFGPAIAARLARAYGVEWPFLPVEVAINTEVVVLAVLVL